MESFLNVANKLVAKDSTDTELIDTLQTRLHNYLQSDPTEFIAPILIIFDYAVSNGRVPVVKWLCENFIMLDVSYNDNFYFNRAINYGYSQMPSACGNFNPTAMILEELIVSHDSFAPDPNCLDLLIQRKHYELFLQCMRKPHLCGLLRDYRFTLLTYVNNKNYAMTIDLIKQIQNGNVNTQIHKMLAEYVEQIGTGSEWVVNPNFTMGNNSGDEK